MGLVSRNCRFKATRCLVRSSPGTGSLWKPRDLLLAWPGPAQGAAQWTFAELLATETRPQQEL